MKPKPGFSFPAGNVFVVCLILVSGLLISSCSAASSPAPAAPVDIPTQEMPAYTGTEDIIIPTLAMEPTAVEVVSTPTMIVEEPTPSKIIHQENRIIEIEWPANIHVGDLDVIRLTLAMDESGKITPTAQIEGHEISGEAIQIPDLYATHNIVAEARLDLVGMEVLPQGSVSEPMSPGKTLNFFWSLRSQEPGVFRGTLWLHLNLVPKDGTEVERVALLAKPIQIKTTTLLGLSTQTARIVSLSGTLFSTILGFPFLETLIKAIWKKIRGDQGST